MSSTFTVTRALAYLKTLDVAIQRAMSANNVISVARVNGTRLAHPAHTSISKDDFKAQAQANFESLNKLLDNRRKLRAALTLSNANTIVTIANQKMSIAEVIEYRRVFLPMMTNYLNLLRSNFVQCDNLVAAEDRKLEELIERQATALYGKNDAKNANSSEFLGNLRTELEKQHKTEVLDPIGLRAYIAEKQAELDKFETEADYVLSEANATTVLSVDLTTEL